MCGCARPGTRRRRYPTRWTDPRSGRDFRINALQIGVMASVVLLLVCSADITEAGQFDGGVYHPVSAR